MTVLVMALDVVPVVDLRQYSSRLPGILSRGPKTVFAGPERQVQLLRLARTIEPRIMNPDRPHRLAEGEVPDQVGNDSPVGNSVGSDNLDASQSIAVESAPQELDPPDVIGPLVPDAAVVDVDPVIRLRSLDKRSDEIGVVLAEKLPAVD